MISEENIRKELKAANKHFEDIINGGHRPPRWRIFKHKEWVCDKVEETMSAGRYIDALEVVLGERHPDFIMLKEE